MTAQRKIIYGEIDAVGVLAEISIRVAECGLKGRDMRAGFGALCLRGVPLQCELASLAQGWWSKPPTQSGLTVQQSAASPPAAG